MAKANSALAIFAHPDDIEFVAAGTLLLLKERGWDIHYFNLADGDLGSLEHDREETRSIREQEARNAAKTLGATFHPSLCNDLQIFYNVQTLRKIGAVVRQVDPKIVLTHSPQDYMTDHENASRLAVTASFAKGLRNFLTDPPVSEVDTDVSLYHAMPHGLRDPLRQCVRAGLYVDTSSVHSVKRQALAAHASQKSFLDATQGMDSYLAAMDSMSLEVGKLSGRFELAEGWRRHSQLGFSSTEQDPLKAALEPFCAVDHEYENALRNPR